ncbi:MAG: DUF4349 domain-containing protein [Solirubrobacterales bacterium]
MERSENDLLLTTLNSLRPAPSPAFAAELDERAAAGFPPLSHPASAPFSRLAAWLAALSPRRMLLAGGATALAAIAIATVVVAGNGAGPSHVAGNGAGTSSSSGGEPLSDFNPIDGGAVESSASGSMESVAPTAKPSAGAAVESEASQALSQLHPNTGPYASGAKHRDVERAAEMVLGTEPSEVGEAAGKVLEAVHQYDGIVLNSSVRGGSEGDAGARFDLLIPSARLSDALAAFSGIAEVRSRHEASNDITAPTNTVGEQLQDSHARIDGLLNQLAGSETEAEREAVEARLRSERRHAATLKSQLSNLQRRANLSHVSVRIETGASNAPSGGNGWGVGDAFHDAGHILAVAAGVAIVGLALLAPIALLALLAWLGNRVWVRQRRERALG